MMPKMTPTAAAAMANDHGRKPHELPWLYLDSVGQEYGPIPGWTMREWLQLGRFPVGRDLRVRLPEWERHLPLHQLYADLGTAFVLPPAWPDMYSGGVLQCDDEEDRPATSSVQPPLPRGAVPTGSSLPQPPAAPLAGTVGGARAGLQGAETGVGGSTSSHDAMAAAHTAAAAKASATAAGVGEGYLPQRPPHAGEASSGSREDPQAGSQRISSRWPSRLVNAPLPSHTDAAPSEDAARAEGEDDRRAESPPPKPQFVLERLMQEEQLLPPPPPQPSQRQLRELLSQPQEGPPLWEDGQLDHAAADAAGPRDEQPPGPAANCSAAAPVAASSGNGSRRQGARSSGGEQ